MAKIFTPIQSIVSSGLIKNQGFAIPQNLTSAVDDFNSLEIPASVVGILESTPDQTVVDALRSLPGCLTGMATQDLIDLVPTELVGSFDFGNVISDIRFQADSIFTNDTKGLIDILPSVESFCVNSFNLLGTFRVMQDSSYDDFGITIGNYNDITTGGVSSQFNDTLEGLNSRGFLSLIEQMGNFGTMFDASQLSRLDDPRVLCQNLLDQGLYQVYDALAKKQIDSSEIFDVNPILVLETLKTISGMDLVNIVSVTKFKSRLELFSLADVLNAEKIFDSVALTAAGGSLKSLAKKLSNIGGNFDSFADLRSTYLSIKTVNIPNLSSMTTLSSAGSSGLFDGDFAELGQGNGIYGNPTVYDVIGSLSGSDYVTKINQLIGLHGSISSSSYVQNLILAIDSSDALAISTAKQALENSNLNTEIQQKELIFKEIFDSLLNERFNLYVAGIRPEDANGTVSGIVSFVQDLHQIYHDPMGLRYKEFIESIVSQDIYGESILAAIAEGNNISVLNNKGVPSYIGLDPVEFRMKIMAKPC